ncbi:MAG: ATP-dependent ligase, partial [Conexibacter sp.]|nr:ATP-dependent ligase [Conexibacter sp.]
MRRSALVGVLLALLVAAAPAAAAPGVLDPTFGSGGVFLGTTFATIYDDQQVVAVDAQGRALVAITQDPTEAGNGSGTRLWVARLTAAGTLDPTFDPGAPTPGLKAIDLSALIGPGDAVTAAAIRPGPGGSIVVLAGISGARIALIRLDGAGGYDASLDGTGRVVSTLAPAGYGPSPAALLVDDAGRPRAFQETASRSMTQSASELVLTPYFFDVLHLDGRDLLDAPATERAAALAALVPPEHVVPRLLAATAEEAAEFQAQVLADGHEGVVVKSTAGAWEAGRRGSGWVKVKPRHTLDLVVLAVEWGSG